MKQRPTKTYLAIGIGCRQLRIFIFQRWQPRVVEPTVILGDVGAGDGIASDGHGRVFNHTAVTVGKLQQTTNVPVHIRTMHRLKHTSPLDIQQIYTADRVKV